MSSISTARASLIHPIQTAVDCDICGKTISRKADLRRHLKTHAINREELYVHHPRIFRRDATLTGPKQNACLPLHWISRERPNHCPEEGCDFSTSDPGSLTRHRRDLHGYEPKANSNSGNHPSAITRKVARKQRRISPYNTSTTSTTSPESSARSVSPLNPSSGMHRSPRPQGPQILPSSLLLADGHVGDGIKNTSAAYSTELITKLSQVNDSLLTSSPQPETSLPLNSGLLTAPEAPVVEHPQLPVPEQGDLSSVDLSAQPFYETTLDQVSDAELDKFLSRFDDVPAYTAPSLPFPVSSTVDNASMSTPAYPPSYEVSYIADNAPYEPYGYPIEAVSFDTQFQQPHSFAAPDMGIYPQVIDEAYFCTEDRY
ncbi:hypothetical protein J3R83DRAFT_5263 [Lanmaoa asiatica]|nr:hypothetical protein J3R83DRAFT_5263 [Lanmaoa asiatica]